MVVVLGIDPVSEQKIKLSNRTINNQKKQIEQNRNRSKNNQAESNEHESRQLAR
jgi:hypothetical protein